MIPIPTLHLRFVEKQVVVESTPEQTTTKSVRVLQQFWEHPDGREVCGTMFKTSAGTWQDVPFEGVV